jgi:hypothetical protein
MSPALYKKLLRLYPPAFKEQLQESMEQTFNDLYKEQQTQHGLSSFVLWMFVETAVGILQEHRLLFKEMNPMKNLLTSLRSPAIFSFVIVLPFMILEWATRSNLPRTNASGILFVIMWLLPMLSIFTLMPIVRNVRAGNRIAANPVHLVLRVVFSGWLIWMWVVLVMDQMPCFLGGSGC